MWGLADFALWNRDKQNELHHARRPLEQKESRKWLNGVRCASDTLGKARRITVVSDRESDLYEDFALKPVNVHVLIRASSNRNLVNGYKLFDHADGLPEAGRMTVNIPASPGKSARQARLALRFGPVTIKRPERGMPSPDLKRLPQTVGLHLVDIREVDAPKGVDPIHWRLLTSHVIEDFGAARLMLDFYRKRWIIEDYFRTLKSAGFKVEDARMTNPASFMNFVALAAIAAVTVTQMLRARNNPSGQPLADAFDPDDKPLLMALCKDYEGE
ncbi:IS4 family transposase, partial [Acidocella aminolytica]|uniref:IS4 family transposase n=1 Tax=Acidocella aminolytica TaxID=33998 RepID=UPI002230ECA5